MRCYLVIEEIAKLRKLLYQIEQDSFVSGLSENEVKVLCAAYEIIKTDSQIQSSVLKSHDFVIKMKPATFHRALKSLINKNFIKHIEGTKAKLYNVTNHALS